MDDTAARRAHLPRPMFLFALAMIVAATVFVTLSEAQGGTDGDIGAGLALLLLVLLGAPWSLVPLVLFDSLTTPGALVCWPALALVNLLLADLSYGIASRRRPAART